ICLDNLRDERAKSEASSRVTLPGEAMMPLELSLDPRFIPTSGMRMRGGCLLLRSPPTKPIAISHDRHSCRGLGADAKVKGEVMGAYCLFTQVPHHAARIGEILEVWWSDYYGAALFGDGEEIACIPHAGCRLEIVATAPTAHRDVNLLLPGHI